jgi:hypothetical protein
MYVLVGSNMLGKSISVCKASAIENPACIEGRSQSHLTRLLAFLHPKTAQGGVWRRVPRSLSFSDIRLTTIRISSMPAIHGQHPRKHHTSRGGNVPDMTWARTCR